MLLATHACITEPELDRIYTSTLMVLLAYELIGTATMLWPMLLEQLLCCGLRYWDSHYAVTYELIGTATML